MKEFRVLARYTIDAIVFANFEDEAEQKLERALLELADTEEVYVDDVEVYTVDEITEIKE